jgi:hypothetical protein
MRTLNNSKNYNHQRSLKSLKFKTPWALIRQCYNDDKQSFRENQNHKIAGLKIDNLFVKISDNF